MLWKQKVFKPNGCNEVSCRWNLWSDYIFFSFFPSFVKNVGLLIWKIENRFSSSTLRHFSRYSLSFQLLALILISDSFAIAFIRHSISAVVETNWIVNGHVYIIGFRRWISSGTNVIREFRKFITEVVALLYYFFLQLVSLPRLLGDGVNHLLL